MKFRTSAKMHNDVEERQKQERLLEIAKHAFQAKYHRENVNWFSKTSMKQSYQGYQQASKLRDEAIATARQKGYYPPTTIHHFLYQRGKDYYHVFEHQPNPAVKDTELEISFATKNPADWKAFEFRLSSGGGRTKDGSEGRNLLAIYRSFLDDGTPNFQYIAYDANSRGHLEHSDNCYATRYPQKPTAPPSAAAPQGKLGERDVNIGTKTIQK